MLGRRCALLHLHQFHQRRGFEGALAGEDLVEHQAQRVDVAAHRDFGAGQLLRRHVGGRAAAHVALQLLGEAGESEIHDDRPGRAPSIITLAGFRSRCRTPFSCAAARPAQSLRAVSTALSSGQAADAAQQRAEVLAVHELHRDVVQALGHADVVDAADVAGASPGAPRGPRCRSAPARDSSEAVVSGRNFSATAWPERQIVGAVDLAHAAAAQQAGDAVAAGDDRAGQEPAFVHGACRAQVRHSGGCRRRPRTGASTIVSAEVASSGAEQAAQ